MRNLEVARILENIGDILELQEVPFKPQAYHKAALAVEFLTEEIKDIYNRGELEEIPGVGKHIAAKIEEILKTGKLKYYEQLKKKVKYPKVMVTTSTKDDRVHPGHARKLVAKMKDLGHPLYYYENIEGGHAGASNNIQSARIMAMEYLYLYEQLGM